MLYLLLLLYEFASPKMILIHLFCVKNTGLVTWLETPPHTEMANVRCDSNSM